MNPQRRFKAAAILYALYGLVYLGGAVAALTPERQRDFFGFVPWWVFYLVGLALVLALPVLVWKQWVWFTRILAFGPAGKALTLIWKQGRLAQAGEDTSLYNWFFAGVAILAALALGTVGWSTKPGSTGTKEIESDGHSNANTDHGNAQ